MGGAGGGAGGGEAVEELEEAGSFDVEVAIIWDDDFIDGGGVAAHGVVVAQGEGFDERAEDAADEFSGWVEVAERHFDADGAMGHRLRGSHGAPLARAVGL